MFSIYLRFFVFCLLTQVLAVNAKDYQALKSESKIFYTISHPLHLVKGVSDDFVCTFNLLPDSLHSLINVKIPVTSFNSGHSSRDSHILEVLEALKYPFVEFVSDSIHSKNQSYNIFGQLTFHGVKRPIEFTAGPLIGKGDEKKGIRIKGGFEIKLTDFKIKLPKLLFMKVEDLLRININVVLSEPPS